MLAIDPMHNLYIGTAKHIFTKVWQKRDLIGSYEIQVINDRISSLNKPSEVSFGRLPACMEYCRKFTAEQWLLWVNYYSLYCLHQVLPAEHIECWRQFVLASHIFCKHVLTSDDIKVADALILQFCKKFETLYYGSSTVTPNIHLHAHLAKCISDFGPISTFWLFSFERFNGTLGDEPTNNRSIEKQMMNRYLKDNSHLQLLSLLQNHSMSSTSFCKDVMEHALNFTSTRHLDQYKNVDSAANRDQSHKDFISDKKYTFHCPDEDQVQLVYSFYNCPNTDII